MTRGVVVALGVWTVIATGWWLFFSGGQVMSCLGPLGVTQEECRAVNGLPLETGPDRFLAGPGVLVLALVLGWAAIFLAGRWRKRRDHV